MQNKVKIFNEEHSNCRKPMATPERILDIISELGELSKEYLKATSYGIKEFKLSDDFALEFGDTLYSMLSLANELEIDCENILDKVLDKYLDRIKSKGSLGSGK